MLKSGILLLCANLIVTSEPHEDLGELMEWLRAEDIFEQVVVSASDSPERLRDAPAAMIVVSAADIEARGYTDLAELVGDLPGFDINVANSFNYLIAYQRGYRAPLMQRTLVMVNGKVDNHLWNHFAVLSRQYPMTNIDRVEVIYGPAATIYGPNAFIGVINIITKNPKKIEDGGHRVDMTLLGGSWNSRGVDATASAHYGDLAFSISGKLYRSDEEDLNERWVGASNDILGNEDVWGPILEYQNAGKNLGTYYDPTDDYGIMADLRYGAFRFEYIKWDEKEAWGPGYAANMVQTNTFWSHTSEHFVVEFEDEILDDIRLFALLSYRQSGLYGEWGESYYGKVNLTSWGSISDSVLTRQNYTWDVNDNLTLMLGLKYERKDLTKNYDSPGYWDGVVSTTDDIGAGLADPTDEDYKAPAPTPSRMPYYNRILTEDLGGFIESRLKWDGFLLRAGIRYDRNSFYGGTVNPRLAAIYNVPELGWIDSLTVKLLYGTGFQEPAPILVWGGWAGRNANEALKPETSQNLELITMAEVGPWLSDLSIYRSDYRHVIKEEAENAGRRLIWGVEYRGRLILEHMVEALPPITAYAYYTYVNSTGSIQYDHESSQWEHGWSEVGDIAPHKLRLGLTVPVTSFFTVSLRSAFRGPHKVYSRNAFRNPEHPGNEVVQDGELPSAWTFDVFSSLKYDPISIGFKIKNLLDEKYFSGGFEEAGAGDNFDDPTQDVAFRNSVIPQPGRSFWLLLRLTI